MAGNRNPCSHCTLVLCCPITLRGHNTTTKHNNTSPQLPQGTQVIPIMMQLPILMTLAGLAAAEQQILAQTPITIDFDKNVHQVKEEYVNAVHVQVQPSLVSKVLTGTRNRLKEAEIIPTGSYTLAASKLTCSGTQVDSRVLNKALLQVIDEFLPSFLVDAEWSSSNYAHLGNTLKPKKLQDAPSLTLTSPGSSSGGEACHALTNTTYTVIITDPDAPSRDDPKWSEFCHWIATGLPVSTETEGSAGTTCSGAPLTVSLTSLDEVMPYYPPGPPEKTGKHRYVFLVFTPENGTTDALHLSKPGDRKHWGYEYEGERVGVRTWAKENGLIPVGEYRRQSMFLLIDFHHH